MEFTITDYIILIIIVTSAIYGAFKGFVSQIVSIISLLLGVWCAFKFSNMVASYIKDIFSIGETAVYIISFTIILIAVIVFGNFLGKGVEKIVQFSMLDWLNRLLGILFCSIKSVVILSLIVYVIKYINKSWHLIPDSLFANSQLYPHLVELSNKIFPYLQSLMH